MLLRNFLQIGHLNWPEKVGTEGIFIDGSWPKSVCKNHNNNLWVFAICLSRLSFLLKLLLQYWQRWGFSPEWVSICLLIKVEVLNSIGQNGHAYLSTPRTIGTFCNFMIDNKIKVNLVIGRSCRFIISRKNIKLCYCLQYYVTLTDVYWDCLYDWKFLGKFHKCADVLQYEWGCV